MISLFNRQDGIIKSFDTNREIFLVVKGKYSNWEVVGYFMQESKAKKYCEKYNALESKLRDYYNEAYVIPVPCLHDYEKCDVVKRKYSFHCYRRIGNTWNIEEDDYCYYSGVCDERGSEILEYNENNIKVYVYMPVTNEEEEADSEENISKAMKIAQDVLYEYLAIREGIV